jgi:hypothetical protein
MGDRTSVSQGLKALLDVPVIEGFPPYLGTFRQENAKSPQSAHTMFPPHGRDHAASPLVS